MERKASAFLFLCGLVVAINNIDSQVSNTLILKPIDLVGNNSYYINQVNRKRGIQKWDLIQQQFMVDSLMKKRKQ